jgi:GNAT superfamily N-acetyltransferase
VTREEESPRPVIEPAGVEDLASIAALADTIWRRHYPGIITVAQIDYMLERFYALDVMRREVTEQGVRYDRLVLDGRPIGFAAYGPSGRPGEVKIHKLYVLPEHHRKGYGSMLLAHVEAQACALGAHMIVLTCNKKNTGSLAVYRKNGFRVREADAFDIGGGFVMDDYVLEKPLPSGD